MEEAIKDKTAQVEAEMAAQQQEKFIEEQEAQEEEKDSDSDFDDDGDFLRSQKEMRIAAIKAQQAQQQQDLINGHGQYNEITEEQFLP